MQLTDDKELLHDLLQEANSTIKELLQDKRRLELEIAEIKCEYEGYRAAAQSKLQRS